MTYSIVFFGSFGHYSALVLDYLIKASEIKVLQVVTTPPIIDKKGKEIKGEVQKLAEQNSLPVLTELPKSFTDIKENFQADFIITAGYGKLLPPALLGESKIASLNLHFSLLPKYRGANPGEWAILMGEEKSGVTIIEMNEEFDKGGTIYQQSVDLDKKETRESLYEKLYSLGGEIFPEVIKKFAEGELKTIPQMDNDYPYATRFKRDDGFIEWDIIASALEGKDSDTKLSSTVLSKIISLQKLNTINPEFIEKTSRALYGFPSLWTKIFTNKGEKRMKIHSCHILDGKLSLDDVQVEGQQKAKFNQVKNIIS